MRTGEEQVRCVVCRGEERYHVHGWGVEVLAHVMVHVVVCLDTVRIARTPTDARLRALVNCGKQFVRVWPEWLIVGLTVETETERTD